MGAVDIVVLILKLMVAVLQLLDAVEGRETAPLQAVPINLMLTCWRKSCHRC